MPAATCQVRPLYLIMAGYTRSPYLGGLGLAHALPWPAPKRLVLPLRALLSRILLPPSSPAGCCRHHSQFPDHPLFGRQTEPSEAHGLPKAN
jgi:hypothetical protein